MAGIDRRGQVTPAARHRQAMALQIGLVPGEPIGGKREAEIVPVGIIDRIAGDGGGRAGVARGEERELAFQLQELEGVWRRGPEQVGVEPVAARELGHGRGGLALNELDLDVRPRLLERLAIDVDHRWREGGDDPQRPRLARRRPPREAERGDEPTIPDDVSSHVSDPAVRKPPYRPRDPLRQTGKPSLMTTYLGGDVPPTSIHR